MKMNAPSDQDIKKFVSVVIHEFEQEAIAEVEEGVKPKHEPDTLTDLLLTSIELEREKKILIKTKEKLQGSLDRIQNLKNQYRFTITKI